ncbi:MAG: hypothetical protein FJW35_02420 [Acidobacteria bacterium]|nr:hypothetical protein [Acidobacteriota bacterium]
MAGIAERMIGAARLDVRTYEEVENDATATGQAMAVVVLSSIAGGLGALGTVGFGFVIFTIIAALIGWFIWAFLTYFIGTRLLAEPQTSADLGQLLRTIGFASSPGILRILGVIPLIGWPISFAVAIWMLAAMVIAVRQALDYRSTGRAVVVCLIGWVVFVAVNWLVLALTGARIGA